MKFLLFFLFCFVIWAFPIFSIGVILYGLGYKGLGLVVIIISLFLKSKKLQEIRK